MDMSKLKTFILNLFFPCRCIFCGALMPLMSETAVCTECMNTLPFCLAHTRCAVCGKTIEKGRKFCSRCGIPSTAAYKKISSAYIYEGEVKRALVRFKHEGYRSYAEVFAEHMKAIAEHDFKDVKFDLIAAVPPRRARISKEGYDQAGYLARELSGRMGIPYCKGVLRQKERRRKQSELSAEDRILNVCGNYEAVKKDRIAGRTLLLVDDICTTGATLGECAKVLTENGAKAVYCVTAATVSESKSTAGNG